MLTKLVYKVLIVKGRRWHGSTSTRLCEWSEPPLMGFLLVVSRRDHGLEFVLGRRCPLWSPALHDDDRVDRNLNLVLHPLMFSHQLAQHALVAERRRKTVLHQWPLAGGQTQRVSSLVSIYNTLIKDVTSVMFRWVLTVVVILWCFNKHVQVLNNVE